LINGTQSLDFKKRPAGEIHGGVAENGFIYNSVPKVIMHYNGQCNRFIYKKITNDKN
jgi:hypothetical protein